MLRDSFLRAIVLLGVALVVVTESLGVFRAINRPALLICWIAILIIAAFWFPQKLTFVTTRDPVVLLCLAACAAVLILTAITAFFSPPNSADAMAYHMPRVVYWAEQASVRFFPTQYFNQIMLQPLAEYAMLQTYVVSGGDHWINFVQWSASLACMVGVSAVAAAFGAPPRGQALAALFCATLPAGILASSSAKNDYVMALWLIAAIYFALRGDALFMGAALGLALLTKATAYLFAPWLLAAILVFRRLPLRSLAIAAACALALNTPQFIRNYNLSGSIMGFDSAQGDGFFRWRNDRLGWKPAVSNILRNASEQLGARSERWNNRVYNSVAWAHQILGINLNDPSTTWPWEHYAPPRNTNHEADAQNRWQVALLIVIFGVLAWRVLRRGRDSERALYALALVLGFASFCAYLKWQPTMARLFLPLFVCAAPLVGMLAEMNVCIQIALCVFLINNARPALFENWVRPLRGPRSVLNLPRDRQYFADMKPWNNEDSYFAAVDVLSQSNCRTIGIDITHFQLEYPLQALLREKIPSVNFMHTGVENASSRYAPPVPQQPCAVVCMDCAGDATRLGMYGKFSRSVVAGRFVLFLD